MTTPPAAAATGPTTPGAPRPAGPMTGVRVVELGVWVAGPAAAGILADWGADVVKIEPPAGDPDRLFRQMLGGDLPSNPVFELDNRSKRSIAIDLTREEGRRVAERLIDRADVFVTNIRPNGDGSLLLKKCMLKFIPSGETVVPDQLTNARCTSRTIDLKTGTPGNGPNP